MKEVEPMSKESSVAGFRQAVVRGRTLILLAVADVLLFVVAAVANGAGNQHGFRLVVSNGVWALFLIGCVLLIVLAIAVVAQSLFQLAKRPA
jgi:Na+-driven multidrug efflux pump